MPNYSHVLYPDEPVILTVHNSGVPSKEETLSGAVYYVRLVNNEFRGFFDPYSNHIYATPSALCCAKLERHGAKQTNQWQGPRHVLAMRDGQWIPIADLKPITLAETQIAELKAKLAAEQEKNTRLSLKLEAVRSLVA
jgi:hypothetical protein